MPALQEEMFDMVNSITNGSASGQLASGTCLNNILDRLILHIVCFREEAADGTKQMKP